MVVFYRQFVVLQASLMKDAAVSVNRCLWSPDGTILGMVVFLSMLLFAFGCALVKIRRYPLWYTWECSIF
jgi:hypothetical protein